MGCTIIGTGKALPTLEVKNDDLAALVDTNDEWISTRTGIKSRHIAIDETTCDLAERAARAALGWTANVGQNAAAITGADSDVAHSATESDGSAATPAAFPIDPESIDLLIVSTITSDSLVPSMASELRRRLGLTNAIAFDLNAACTGFIYGVTVAESMMLASAAASGTTNAAGTHACARPIVRRALVVGAERMSRITNWDDRTTCVLFGDGSGAAVLEWKSDAPGILGTFLANADDTLDALSCPTSYETPVPFDQSGVAPGANAEFYTSPQVISMNGQEVFKFASNAMSHAVSEVLDRCGRSLDDIALIVPHQANERIVKYAAKKLGCSMDRFFLNIANTGNTSAASVPMALADAYASGRISRGDLIVLVGFGGGYTSGAVLYEA